MNLSLQGVKDGRNDLEEARLSDAQEYVVVVVCGVAMNDMSKGMKYTKVNCGICLNLKEK